MWTAEQVANWFLVRHSSQMQRDEAVDEQLTQMKLHKLIYYAQGVFLALFDDRLIDEELLAWQHGPVVYSIYNKYRGYRELDIEVSEEQLEDYKSIVEDEESDMVLEAVYETFGNYSAGQLRNMTHEEDPWVEAWANRETDDTISEDTIQEYFKENIVEV